ncbi:elongation factor G [Eubacterium multiforme]|uniref:Elongation factor G n=1 Tax=Eubacterium multiforme TaxID=83339 RepID=A0ABT9UXI6_9FIRM|nr:elongation factor G [Eubacterium multiforme]MDQ0151035.1 elongation factor G [Eubacterium multiforme]
MKDYHIKNLRNIGFIGHGGTGKTSLVEGLLYSTNTISRLGKIEDGTTTSDFDEEEKRRGISLSTTVSPLEWENKKVNLVDIPGYFDFEGEFIEGIKAVDIGVIVVCGVSGVEVGTEKAWDFCKKIEMPKAFFINKLDRENSSFDKTLNNLKEKFGEGVVPIQYPIGKEDSFSGVINVISKKATVYNLRTNKIEAIEIPKDLEEKIDECKEMLMEAVAENDEELLEKYFSEGSLSDEEIYRGLINGCSTGDIAPVMCGSSIKAIGMNSFLDDVIKCFPSPELSLAKRAINENGEEEYLCLSEDGPFSAIVFKTVVDPFVGKISLFRVITGKLKNDMSVINSNKKKGEKLSNIFFMRGKNQVLTKEIVAGDIGGVSKLQFTGTGDTLVDPSFKITYENFNFKEPVISMAVIPKAKGDEEKISLTLNKLLEEDLTFDVRRDKETGELIISGMGETHLEVIACKIKNKFGTEVILREPKVPYRETIKGTSDVQGKHKKQSGGHGQYGDVKIKFERRYDGEEDLEFVDKVVGGAVPRNFIPAVEKGLKDCIKEGVLAGYPVIGLRATLYDGSHHPVDSSEMAFKIAASIAYKKGLENAKPILLEPIMKVVITVPEEYMGDIICDINKKRGRIVLIEPKENNQSIICEVPLAEMFKYSTDIKSITQARGEYKMEFERYEEVPENEAIKIIENSKKEN